MNYKIVKAQEKPKEAPPQFTIYDVCGDEYIFCPVRKRVYKVNNAPEEKVRQWWLYRLREMYDYNFDQMAVEVAVLVGSTEAKKRADIVIYQDTNKSGYRIFIEVKNTNRLEGLDQLKVYMNATGCKMGLWSNGVSHIYLLRIEPNESKEEPSWRELRNIPSRKEELSDVDTPITRKELEPVTDFLSILKQCENYIKAHEGSSAFDEIFKLIFTKLYDEKNNLRNDDSPAQFRVGILEASEQTRERIINLFNRAKDRWSGVFKPGEEIHLTDEVLAYCVSTIQKIYFLKSQADVLGSAFEVMVNPGMKGDKGQYFTPRHVIKLCIEVLQPKDGETIFDPACGSGGFLVGGMEYVYKQIEDERDNNNDIIENKKDYANECVFGMDYDHLIAKVAKAYMLIWGDGRSNIAVCDSLNENNWGSEVLSKFTEGKGTKTTLRKFDIIATNPPFGGDIDIDETLSKYELAYKSLNNGKRKRVNKLSREKLFIERCLNMLVPGGRMAIVLPRGILKNYNDEYIRRYIIKQARIVAVVNLGSDMFKPFTNTKTCILFLQKRENYLDNIDSFLEDDPIVFTVTEFSGKDKKGNLNVDINGTVKSDLPEIANFIIENIKFN